jgi:hypothetical protein
MFIKSALKTIVGPFRNLDRRLIFLIVETLSFIHMEHRTLHVSFLNIFIPAENFRVEADSNYPLWIALFRKNCQRIIHSGLLYIHRTNCQQILHSGVLYLEQIVNELSILDCSTCIEQIVNELSILECSIKNNVKLTAKTPRNMI